MIADKYATGYRKRLRPAWTDDELAKMYAKPHDHTIYGYGHHLRVEHTVALGAWLVQDYGVRSMADLSCGNAAIARRLQTGRLKMCLGDYAPGYEYQGPLEQTIEQIPEVDLFICSETIEHVDDPEAVLNAIRGKARLLLMSTPIAEKDLGNPEHYWGWDQLAVASMLGSCGWRLLAETDVLLPDTYSYQISASIRS